MAILPYRQIAEQDTDFARLQIETTVFTLCLIQPHLCVMGQPEDVMDRHPDYVIQTIKEVLS